MKNNIISDFTQAVFAGENAREEYINPQNHLPTPLIELIDETCNPFKDDRIRIFAKDLRLAPLGQVKSGTIHQMYKDAKESGKLHNIQTIHEASSGNTGAALALLAAEQTVVYVNDETPEEKIKILQLLGAQVIMTNDGVTTAQKKGTEYGNINLNQYGNISNPHFFEKVIGPQIWDQTNGIITIFCTGLGTTGTMIGISKYLKKQNKNIQTIGVIVKDGDSISGVRTKKRLEEISLPWEQAIDKKQIVTAKDSYTKSLELIRKSTILAGPSSGFALQGLLQELTDLKNNGNLDSVRNQFGEVIAVFPILDSPWLYIYDYFKQLDASLFKDVQKI